MPKPDYIIIDRALFEGLLRQIEALAMTTDNTLTVQELASVLGCSIRNANSLIERGRVELVDFKGLRLVRAASVDRLLA